MKRYELYLDNYNRLMLSKFKNTETEHESRIYKGIEIYDVIKRLASSKLVDYAEIRKKKDLILEYENYVIYVTDQNRVFQKIQTTYLVKNIKDFNENKSLKTHKHKKVTRKNKHVGRKIMAGSLVSLILIAGASNYFIKNPEVADTVKDKVQSTMVDLNFENTNILSNLSVINESSNIETEEEISRVTLDYPDWSETDKAYIVKSNYGDLLTKYAKRYGLDPKLVIAIATQETDTGYHKSTMDPGGATGIMQIQNEVWVGNDVCAYNFETKEDESLRVTNDNIGELESNIRIGCMILQGCMNYMNHNILAGVQSYNMGPGSLEKILTECSRQTGRSKEVILKDVTNPEWMDYRKIIDIGEPEYVEKVFSWMGEDNIIKNEKSDGTLVSINVSNQLKNKKMY